MNALPLYLTGKGFGFLRGDSTKMPQITLVSDQHYDDILVGMVTELLEPALHILVGYVLGNVVHQEGSHCAAIVPAEKSQSTLRVTIGATRKTTGDVFCSSLQPVNQATAYALVIARYRSWPAVSQICACKRQKNSSSSFITKVRTSTTY